MLSDFGCDIYNPFKDNMETARACMKMRIAVSDIGLCMEKSDDDHYVIFLIYRC